MAKYKVKQKRFPYRRGERVFIKRDGAGNFVRYNKDGSITVERFGGYKEKYPQKKIEPMTAILRRK
jgi:hypothetical protein